MRSARRTAGVEPAEPQTARPSSGLLSPGERALWFLHRLTPGSAAYNLAGALRIAHLDVASLRRAVLRLVERHAALRTTFSSDQGEPFRRVQGWIEPEIVEEDVTGLACGALRKRCEVEALRPFDPEHGPLLRVRIFRSGHGGCGAAVFVFHHLIADFWSLTVILRELGEVYQEETGGTPAELLPPPAPYEQWVERQGLELSGPRGEALRAFWKERLAGPEPVLDLPADRPRPVEPGGAGVGGSGRLGAEMTARLLALARERRATLFAAMLAGYQLLLHRITGDEEIWIGVPAAGRSAARWSRTVGYFVNPVVLRGRPGEAASFAGLLDGARGEAEEALAHRDWPFPWLAEELHPVREAGRTPLFQAMLVLYRTRYPEEEPLALLALGEGGGKARLGGLELETLPLGRRGAQLDVSLTAAVVAGELRFRLELDADRFDAATAGRLLGHLEALLEAAAERPDAPVEELPLLREAERQALFVEWNDPRAVAPAESSLDSLDALVGTRAARTPHATAVVSAEGRLTYRELMDRAESLARCLRALGAGPEARVGICAGRSAELVVGILAILRAGAAYVPLDPAHPRERLAWILEDSGAALLLTESSRLPLFAEPPFAARGGRTVLLDAAAEEPAAKEPAAEEPGFSAPLPSLGSTRLAYILYTSGSTGVPKGVALSHGGALALLRWAGGLFPDEDLSGVLASTSVGFDLSVFELFLPLSRGGTVLLVPDALHAGVASGVTLINTVPSAMAELVRLGAVPPTVRVVCLAGERLPGSLAAAVHRAVPGCRVLNLYGPTEGTTYSTWFEVEPESGREPAIGRPVGGTRVHLVDRRLRPLPVGVVGELFLAGLGLARGYVGRPDLTAERFLPDPWSPEPGGRLYRTGDLGRRRPDGVLELLGRFDQQVKLRGFRIELGEVEAALAAHPAVREAAVEVRENAAGDRRLVAWTVGADGDADPAALRDFLGARLPDSMLPSIYAALPALPLTPNGKVDRRALAARPLPDEGETAGYVPPRNTVEDRLAALFTEVLGRRQVGAEDDFFASGGHSLLATRLLARVRTVFGVDLPLRSVFTAPTVARLGEVITAARHRDLDRRADEIPLRPAPRSGPLPLSFSQRRLWVLHQITPGLTAYHIPAGLRLRGRLDAAALERALGEIVRRHEALRTSFPLQEIDPTPSLSPRGERGMGFIEPVQAIAPAAGFRLAGADLSCLPEDRREAAALRIGETLAREPFDLERGPLLRLLLLRLGPDEHLLVLVVHHLVFDGWSTAVFLRELSVLYTAFLRGLQSPLPEPGLQYADWALWQRAWLRGEALEEQLRWWRHRLESAPRVLDLPTDFPYPPVETHAGAAVPVRLPEALVARARTLGRAAGGEDGSATLFMVLLASFQALLARLSGQETVSAGTHVAGRNRLESEDLIGFFVNTVVIRTDLDGDPSGRELIARVREGVLGAFAHQDLPFEKLVEALNPARDLRRSPLFQVAFTFQNLPREELRLPGLAAELLEVSPETAPYELSLTLAEDGGPGVSGGLRYNTALFAEPTALRLVRYWEACLEGLVAEPGTPVSALSILGAAERRQILAWSREKDLTDRTDRTDHRSDLRGLCLHELFARQAAGTPDAVALVEAESAITYGELDRRSALLARRLRAAGAGPDTPVAVLLERSAEMVVALVGIVRAGAAYVPLDLGYPRERLAWMLEDSGARVVVTRGGLAVEGREVLRIDDLPAGETVEPPAVSLRPDHLAYILYTSGTTGRPKGVAVPHRAVARLVIEPGYVELGPGETILQLAPVPFDASTFEIWGALLNGGRLAIFPAGPVSLHELAAALSRHRVTTVFLTAGLFHQMIDEMPEGLAGLRQLIAGGDAVSVEHARLALERLPGCRLINGYGPTEATTFALCHPVAPADAARPTLSLGRPIARTGAWILDGRLQPVPPGVTGELYLSGDGLARGYWRQPDRTAARFVPHPFAAGPGERLYRTGDLARWQANGNVDFLGRIDRQVKIRGFRVEPAEVEAALELHPAIAAAVVAPRLDGRGDKWLVAWVVPVAQGLSDGELLAWCRDRLPAFLVPGAFVWMESLPLDPNGKVDRRALPEPERQSGHYVAPRTPEEERIAAIWADLLGLPQVGVLDDFFELGGHSLLATRVIARVRAAFGVDLPVRVLFEHPTVAALAGEIGWHVQGGPVPLPPPRPRPHGAVAPLSFAQRRLWVLHQLDEELIAYHIPAALRLRGRLDGAAFERALGEIVRRHEALRTSFPVREGEPVQAIAPFAGFRLAGIDLSHLPEDRREAEAWRIGNAAERRPFDLERGPLLRFLLLRLREEEHVLFLVVHHLVFDGWSTAVFLRELSALYAAFRRGLPSPLPEPRLQYADWALWQHEWLRGEILEEQLRWWRDRLESAPRVLDLPTDFPHPPLETYAGASMHVRLPDALVAGVRAFGRGPGSEERPATVFMILLAAFQALLARLSGQTTVCTGTHVADRNRLESEDLIGFFVNTVVIRADLDGNPSGREIVARVRERVLGAFAHQDLPFEKLVEALNPARDLRRSPLFQVAFTLHNLPREDLRLPGLETELLEVSPDTAQYELSLTLWESGDRIAGGLQYRTSLFVEPTVRRLLRSYEVLLGGLVADPGAPISELPLLGQSERHQILAEWGDGDPARPMDLPVHALIRRRAEAAPDEPAVFFEGRPALTWRELRRRTLRLARSLRGLGAGPGAVVGISLDRSPDLVVAVLGTLETGAAYLPLDPHYPKEYLAYVVEDSEVSIVLSRETLLPAQEPGEEPGPPTGPPPPPESWAYVLYTSGSTGKPKGTPVTHRALLNYLEWAVDEPLAGTDGVLFLTSLNFDASLKQLLAPLLQGRAVRLVSDESARRPERLLRFFGGGGRLALNCVPSLWRAILDLLESGPAPAAAQVPALARLLLGGEGFDRDLAERTWRLLPELEIWNLYGPTETTANASSARLTADDRFPVGIGRPLRGACLHVLDPFQRPVPPGPAGELVVGGAGVSPGYWRRPELTAERFVPDPFATTRGARMFRTGDLARWRSDGSLELLGRIDRQLKIRGLRIEPGEVEAALASYPAVAECVVGTDPEGSRLVAWVVARAGFALLTAELRRYLEALLPASLVPALFVILGSMPRLPNGKVSHAALPRPEAPVPRAAAALPRTQAEEVLAWLWCEVLEVPEVGVHDDFFERGGHSLLATRLLARVRSVFGIDLPLRTVFAAPTVARLAEAIAAARRDGRRQETVPVEPVPRSGPLPLSFAQERLWFIDQWIPESPAYNIPAAVRLRGPLDEGALRAALAEIVRRHETLRTTFSASGGRPVQILHPGMEISLPVVDLGGLAGPGTADGVWRTLAGEEARRGFDLWRGPLLRNTLLALGADNHVLVVNLHHIIADGWSMGVLVEELRALYAAFHAGRPSPLPALPVQYVDYAVWQRRLLEREALARDLDWWRGVLAGAPAALELPADRPRPLWSIHRGAVEPAALPPALTARLHELARRGDVTLFMVLLAAFELLLARLAGVKDLVVGTAVAQRTPEVEGLIGLFVNLLALRGDLAGDPPFTELLARTRRATLEAHDHQDVPFERLVAALEPVRDPGRHPLFQVALTLQNAPRPAALLPGLDLEIEQLDTGTARFDLTLLLHEADGGLAGALEHSADLFDRSAVRRLLASYESLLTGLVNDPHRPVSLLPLVSDAERRQILEEWSMARTDQTDRTDPTDHPTDRSDRADPSELCLHHLFARQAARTPGAVALLDLAAGGVEMTYRELDRRSALLARRLRAAGAGPDVPVAVLLERSADMVVALLGILRSGAGYVPLDLAYPRERLAWMLDDSGARLVVTRGGFLPLLGNGELAGRDLEMVRIDDLPADVAPAAPAVPASPDNLAYIVYTSGSTGKPKGVAATHRGVARVVIDPGYVELGPEETILQLAPVPFDASTFEIWGALLNRGRLAIFPPGPVSLRELAQALARSRATTLFLTTGLFHQMVDEELPGLAGLRQLITGGDVVSVERVRRALEGLPGCRLIHAYGPTETTTFATCHPVTRADTARPTLTLGRPIHRTSVWLLDERLEPVPPGVPGEMYLGGDGLARGYWRRPDLTAPRFVPHPFAAAPGERLYRTGDLARWLPDGTVDFLGRIDRQVKIRGFRVEPAEIESTLERHPGIGAAVVQPRDDGRGNKRLVAWIVPASPEMSGGLAETELLAWCREHLPAFMVPGALVLMEALPLDPNGKVDRRVLPDPDPGQRGSFVAPRTPLEARVAGVWGEVLGLEQVGAEDDFFELGGHSLLATQIVARLERELGVEVGLRAFFDEPSVAGVALAITREQMRQEDPERIERLLAQVQDLSPEELAKLLREEA
jgi:amino acid adenylation domain-containing protein